MNHPLRPSAAPSRGRHRRTGEAGSAVSAWFLVLCAASLAAADEPLRANPFNDPFERATSATAACPVPRGPAYSESQMRAEAHSRIERGTTCWLSGLCSEPNAYRYDARVAQGVVAALRGDAELDRAASIWVIVQRRIVYLQGCVASPQQARRAEAIAAAVPEVERVIPSLSAPGEAPLYPLQSDTAR
ncbi:MAG: BON domain-containing protein [Betaproteobacteria bacterium]|nr:MAG: BON domain-containing protein [Betaproteobacteria bacterium]